MNNLQRYIDLYEKKTGESVDFSGFSLVNDLLVNEDNEYLKVYPSGEWFTWAVREENGTRYLWLGQTCGNVATFVPYINQVMDLNNLQKIVTATARNPAAHMRKWKMSRLEDKDYEFEGRHYYVLIGDRQNLRG